MWYRLFLLHGWKYENLCVCSVAPEKDTSAGTEQMLDGGKGAFKGFWRPGFSCVNFHSHRPCVCENTPTHISRNGLSTPISFTSISWQMWTSNVHFWQFASPYFRFENELSSRASLKIVGTEILSPNLNKMMGTKYKMLACSAQRRVSW